MSECASHLDVSNPMEKLLEHLGYATPFIYAAAAYGLFAWLDENLSDAAKTALAATMKIGPYDEKHLASALVEIFDRIYTYPLLRWSAFLRSTAYTAVVTIVYAYETGSWIRVAHWDFLFSYFGVVFLTNALSDYVSLFAIRRWLVSSAVGPVLALSLGTLFALLIVYLGVWIRDMHEIYLIQWRLDWRMIVLAAVNWPAVFRTALPAIIVFAWIPLLALGLLSIRLVPMLMWTVAKAQWTLKEGEEHPLRAVGCVAAVIVFALAAIWQVIFKA